MTTTDEAAAPHRTALPEAAAAVLGTVSVLLDGIDWDHIAAQLERAETIGPILLPTEFTAALHSGRLTSNSQAVAATRTYLAALRRIHQETTTR